MGKISKKRKAAEKKYDLTAEYSVNDAMKMVRELSTAKFDGSIDLHIHLGVDPKKPDQGIRSTVVLPHGTGKNKTVLVLCTPDKEAEAKEAGADYVGLDDLVQKIQGGWTDVDVVIATPNVMAKVGRIGRILGPRGLMPNPKTGTVTMDVGKAVNDVKGGKIAFRVDKFGIIHSPIGKVSFDGKKLVENAMELLTTLIKLKPSSVKGDYMKSIYVAPTMGPAVKIDTHSI